MPVVLDINSGLPEAEVLPLGVNLPRYLIRLPLEEVHKIRQLAAGLREAEVSETEGILVIVELPPDQAGTHFDVMRAAGPGQRTLFLEDVIDVEDRNKPIVAQSEAAASAAHGRDVDSRQSGDLVVYVGIRHPKLGAGVGALIGRGSVQPEPRKAAFQFHYHRGTDDVNEVHHIVLRVGLRRTREDSATRADCYAIHRRVGKQGGLRVEGRVVGKTREHTVFVGEAMIDTGVVSVAVIGALDVAVVIRTQHGSRSRVRRRKQLPVLQRYLIQLVGRNDGAANVSEVSGVPLFEQSGREDDTGGFPRADSQSLIVAEEKRLVFLNAATDGAAKLVLAVGWTRCSGSIGEEIVRIELVITQELIETAMEIVGSRFRKQI